MADLRIIMNILSGPYRWIWVSKGFKFFKTKVTRNSRSSSIVESCLFLTAYSNSLPGDAAIYATPEIVYLLSCAF